MAKEQVRKRGKRKPKNVEEEYPKPVPHAPVVGQDTSAGPSFHPSRAALLSGQKPSFPIPTFPPGSVGEEINSGVPDINPDYPFGQLDPDLKAYFRTVEDQIKDWEGISSSGEEREDRQTFLSSVLTELRDHELVVATDPETSIVLERLLPSLGDWGRRVIGDAFGEQWTVLLRHRFGSHVVQTWLTLAGDTLDRESKNMFPPQHHAQAEHPELGILPTMSTLLSSLLSEIIPNLSTLISDTHSSPPIRLLFLLLSPDRPLPSLEERDEKIRSKRSGKFRKNQGVKGMSIFGEELGEEKGKGKSVNTRFLPTELVGARKRSRKTLMESVKEGEWKILGVHPVGSIVVQMMLEFENEEDEAEKPGSLFDILTEGMITQILDPQAFMTSLQTSPTGTRLYEALLLYSPWPIFQAIWKTYFVGNIGKLSIHPFANFVVSKGISRLGAEEMEGVIKECVELQGGTGMISEHDLQPCAITCS
ncbi:hypothetical protein TREMEDRAFT_67052 [Tremella mesenterica DSM 1558]|uniref:uncharacterized protein n=1 Tax=Tremella mesenterica (strain ATCC 24925 / CBS 8224 / DSM 1558 / NBRC 9311 / NRRL Y-6157 / RJB 2259-6 / UBC 559-6) TaxID=578456 RepID=UPI0003F4916A|nr:uncharacterized protein TREMEDRAFT_67052 [Tremella mesenterica DSM 1558]EIW72780.1 hypothetical protein TREMEDRAFT_67052 [Tremella mesenterica DSM 1558]